MQYQDVIAVCLLYSFLMAMTVSAFAAGRNRGALNWFVIGLFFHLPALILVLVLPRGVTRAPRRPRPRVQYAMPSDSNDSVHALKRLAHLKINGAIDDAEYVAKKAELLARV